jgi:hypothetical protein
MNEAVYVKADDQTLYFEALGIQSYGREKEKLTFQGAAELFWDIFSFFIRAVEPIGSDLVHVPPLWLHLNELHRLHLAFNGIFHGLCSPSSL